LSEVAFKYRAFLSYSHADSAVAQRVHRRLEAFHIDSELVGRVTPAGAIPKTLRPIFRDRNDFDAGSSLNEQTGAALDDSAALIVLASPNAARSRYVNEEVLLFKSHHPDRPVVPLIADGAPGDPERECFPRALRFVVAPDGAITDTPADVLAADLRESGDGFELALAKVVARLLGLSPDDIYRRAERARQRRTRILAGLAGVFLFLAVAAAGSAVYAWQQLKTNEAFLNATLQTATGIVNTAVAQAEKYNVPRTTTLELLTQAEVLFDDMARFGRATPELRYRKAWMLIQFARNYAVLGDTGKQREHATNAFRLLAALAAEKPDDTSYQRNLAVAYNEVGEVQVTQGDLMAALTSFQAGFTIVERLTASDSGNAGWQHDLWVSDEKIGNVQVARGKLPDGLTSYRAGLAIIEQLATSNPSNGSWQRDLSVSYDKIGGVQVTQGNLPAALASYQSGFAIIQQLAQSTPGNAGWQRDLAVSYNQIGAVQVAQGNLSAALISYRASLAIIEGLTRSDQGNAVWQYDLGFGNEKIGDVQLAQGNFAAALNSYQANHEVIERLANADPGNSVWQRDLSVSYAKIGDVEAAQGNLPAALTSYKAYLAICEGLAKSDPDNAVWQRDLIISYVKIANVAPAQAGTLLMRAKAIADDMQERGILAPRDAWMPDDLAKRIAQLK
jgi:tetratricopeptide (TPR) repeat protein